MNKRVIVNKTRYGKQERFSKKKKSSSLCLKLTYYFCASFQYHELRGKQKKPLFWTPGLRQNYIWNRLLPRIATKKCLSKFLRAQKQVRSHVGELAANCIILMIKNIYIHFQMYDIALKHQMK